MKSLLAIVGLLLIHSQLVAADVTAKGAHREPIKVWWFGKLFTITNPKTQLWSQHEVAMTQWPMVLDWRKDGNEFAMNEYPGAQRRVTGVAGDRTNRNFLVITLEWKTNRNGTVTFIGRRLDWHTNRYVRPDPYLSLPRPSGMKSSVVRSSVVVPTPPPTVPLWLVWSKSQVTNITIEWDRNPASESVTGYRVHRGMQSRSYSTNWNAGNDLRITLPLEVGTNYFAVVAYSAQGESEFSSEVVFLRTAGATLRASLQRTAPITTPVGIYDVQVLNPRTLVGAAFASTTNKFLPLNAVTNGLFRVKERGP